ADDPAAERAARRAPGGDRLMALLELANVSLSFGGLRVVSDLDLDVEHGENIAGLPPHVINQRGVARTFQTLRLFLNMSVKDNVMAAAYGKTRAGIFR